MSAARPARRSLLLAGLLVGLLAPAAARAGVSASAIAVPASPFVPAPYDESPGASNPTYAFSGSSNGSTGDAVDLDCLHGTLAAGASSTTLASAAPVGADGAWHTTQRVGAIAGQACRLVAVPAGSPPPANLGALVPISAFPDAVSDLTVPAGAAQNAGVQYGFTVTAPGAGAVDRLAQAGEIAAGCGGIEQTPLASGTLLAYSPAWLCGAGFAASDALDPARSQILIDGRPGYLPATADGLYGSGAQAAGEVAAGLGSDQDQVSVAGAGAGELTVTEQEPVLECSGADAYPPTASSCPSFVASGVYLQRQLVTSDGGQVVQVQDTWSAPGAGHALDLLYDERLGSVGSPQFAIPAAEPFASYGAGQALGPFSGAGTMAAEVDPGAGAGQDPGAALTWEQPPQQIVFAAPDDPMLHYSAVLPAGGALTLRFLYAAASSAPAAAGLVQGTPTGLLGPTLTVNAPANGATLTSTPVTVSGTATDPLSPVSVTVNGQVVSVGAGGAFSTSVPLTMGANTITVVATDLLGEQSTAQLTDTYNPFAGLPTGLPPVHHCIVPRIVGLALARGKRAIANGGCRIGRVRSERSRSVARGRIASATRKPGAVLKIGSAVGLTESLGRPRARRRSRR
ncbi:MAG TPA: Ig-like domain-containing protein [Solirubrobacteraceae bacterium]|nr:Ig-like domain-containing protein [Solirubrobacteraceae bacterium]